MKIRGQLRISALTGFCKVINETLIKFHSARSATKTDSPDKNANITVSVKSRYILIKPTYNLLHGDAARVIAPHAQREI